MAISLYGCLIGGFIRAPILHRCCRKGVLQAFQIFQYRYTWSKVKTNWHAASCLIGLRICSDQIVNYMDNTISMLFVVRVEIHLFTYIINILLICCQTTIQASLSSCETPYHSYITTPVSLFSEGWPFLPTHLKALVILTLNFHECLLKDHVSIR